VCVCVCVCGGEKSEIDIHVNYIEVHLPSINIISVAKLRITFLADSRNHHLSFIRLENIYKKKDNT
jgi:hypothetical protein